ncbi:PadR family transcriptional regulator [Alkalihalobacillus pseudalcaliphilus]|nr:PadR family transcriptional regulator [Alkalihalobacillus pseudalcaliphilus]
MTETAFYILFSLDTPKHGYGIIKHVEILTSQRIKLGSGTVYGTLTKMEKDQLIIGFSDGDRKTVYEITELGITVLQAEMTRIDELYQNVIQKRGAFQHESM